MEVFHKQLNDKLKVLCWLIDGHGKTGLKLNAVSYLTIEDICESYNMSPSSFEHYVPDSKFKTGAICEKCESDVKEVYICERCDEAYCDDCSSTYNQFSEIDYNCCSRCANASQDY